MTPEIIRADIELWITEATTLRGWKRADIIAHIRESLSGPVEDRERYIDRMQRWQGRQPYLTEDEHRAILTTHHQQLVDARATALAILAELT